MPQNHSPELRRAALEFSRIKNFPTVIGAMEGKMYVYFIVFDFVLFLFPPH